MGGILGLVIGPLTSLLERLIPDPTAQANAKLQLLQLSQSGQLAELDGQVKEQLAAAGIVQAEAQSANWLTAAWRPITMLIFVGLICARVFGYTSAHVSDTEYMQLWDLVKLGLGGYVIGRSAEKMVPGVVTAITGALKK